MRQARFDSKKLRRCCALVCMVVGLATCAALPALASSLAAPAASGPFPPPGEPGDANWATEMFGIPGVDARVYALAIDALGDLYAGGDFYSAGDVAVQGIARWDGAAWHPLARLGWGFDMDDPVRIRALAVDSAGDVYVGGLFRRLVDGYVLQNIARWDGAAWHPMTSGFGGVYALAVGLDGSVYAGGDFTIARWDGQAWRPLGNGLNGPVYALAVGTDGSIYAGGNFTTAGGLTATHIARWDGSSWHPVGNGTDDAVNALTVSADDSLYAGGEFAAAGGTAANHIARWDGRSWHSLGSGANGDVHALALDDQGHVLIGGQFTAAGGVTTSNTARWDGTAWHALGTGLSGADACVKALVVDQRRGVIAGGQFINSGPDVVSNIARWDGNDWGSLGTGNAPNAPINALIVAPEGHLFAGGEFTTAGEVIASHIARWDGAMWQPLGSGVDGSSVTALAMDGSGNLYAGGAFSTAGGVPASNIARWDGQAWYALGSGLAGQVNAVAVDETGSLYAAGTTVSRWDGTSWHHLADVTGGAVYTLAVDEAGSLYAGGDFTAVEGVSAKYLARWDGTSWTALGVGTNGLDCYSFFLPCLGVHALLLDDLGNVYAGGDFDRPDLHDIAYWDGAAWQPIGQAQHGPYYPMGIFALTRDNAGNLYAAGDSPRIARWNGVSWQAMGRGLSSTRAQDAGYGLDLRTVSALAVDSGGNLYAGGRFNLAGGKLSVHVARWTAADGECGLGVGSHTYYVENLPVTVDITIPGTLDCITIQRFDRSHPHATLSLATGAYWSIASTASNGDPATGYILTLTLPTTFAPDDTDRICRYTDNGWVCGASSHAGTSITLAGVAELSDWAVQRNSGIVSRWWFPLAIHQYSSR